jgi:Flp pilus assembly protein TadD
VFGCEPVQMSCRATSASTFSTHAGHRAGASSAGHTDAQVGSPTSNVGHARGSVRWVAIDAAAGGAGGGGEPRQQAASTRAISNHRTSTTLTAARCDASRMYWLSGSLVSAPPVGESGVVTSVTLGGVGVGRDARARVIDDLSGQTLAGRYDILALLGSGGMGSVYRTHDRELDEMVALKVIRSDHVHTRGMVEQFRHEVKLARRVTHVNIARTFELGVEGELMFCTMELVEGESLRERLLREGAFPMAKAAEIAVALCEGLAVAHSAGVIHRDIKPENVLLTPTGRVVLADFGVAAFGAADSDGALVGTLEYMAPEQARGEQATPATDIYALGVVLFEMLTGLRAFSGTMSELIVAKQDVDGLSLDFADAVAREPLPDELKDVVAKATARDPAGRIATAQELGRRLHPWLAIARLETSPGIDLGAVERRESAEPAALEELPTVVVLAPRAVSQETSLHVAEGIHQELLRRLAERRLRMWARADAFEMPGATFVSLVAGTTLTVTLRRDDLSSTLELPLDIANVALAADAIAVAATELATRTPDADATERLDVLLRARTFAHKGFDGIRPAMELLEQAHARWPADPQISCQLADLLLRFVFINEKAQTTFHHARALVESALAGAPHLAEAHVAAGQLALHTGDPVHAAREFRIAIACSPYQAEPHEGLGRMLLEAGFLDDATARLDNALAIAPKLSSVRWEIARAHALEQNWWEHERLVTELRKDGDRPIARMRFAIWRGERDTIVETRGSWLRFGQPFEVELMQRIYSTLVDGTWATDRDVIVRLIFESNSPSKRRRSFLSQVGAEIAGAMGDVELCLRFLEHAVALDFIDRHWLDRCPTIAAARATPRGERLQLVVRRRAESILDALFGDRESVADTIFTP